MDSKLFAARTGRVCFIKLILNYSLIGSCSGADASIWTWWAYLRKTAMCFCLVPLKPQAAQPTQQAVRSVSQTQCYDFNKLPCTVRNDTGSELFLCIQRQQDQDETLSKNDLEGQLCYAV